ncbi:S-layer homology domain-containing protein [Anoxynatronum buryatiense]|uniref:S-layer homology domain-containing protein n=1 Tax=Anoxynatronum buryatiense TaxID=489973 RepID=A0AA45WW56_9CLOT|nr:S-layer homology domain-containing protein [Anoxynatronum buryatiense]SMP56645.1 S-layer homology domain-containing protein [Anoxynatronum buryatiense]
MCIKSKWVLLAMCALMVLSSGLTAFASVQFTDVPANHWAYSHIRRAADTGIIGGYTHATTGQRVYDPENPVTRLQAVVMVYETLKATNDLKSQSDFTQKYNSLMTAAGVPWGQKQVAYALEYGILTTTELTMLMNQSGSEPKQNPATREEVAVFFSRALNPNQEGTTTVNLTYKDAEMINSAAMLHVNFLTQHRILTGDDQGNFNPRAAIRRSEMAAVISKAYDWLNSTGNEIVVTIPVETKEPEKEEKEEEKETRLIGVIQLLSFNSNRIYLVEEGKTRVDDYPFTNDTRVYVRGSERGLSSLQEDQTAEFTLNKEGIITRIEVDPQRDKVEGTLQSLVDMTKDRGYYVLRIVDSGKNVDMTLQADEKIPVMADTTEVDFDWLTIGERVVVYYRDKEATKIEKLDTINDAEGTLAKRVTRFDNHITLTSGNVEREYLLGEDLYIRIEGRSAELSDLMTGDIITLRLRDGKVTRIDAKQVELENTVEGTIVAIQIARTNMITIEDRRGTEKTYEITDGARVFIDNERKAIADLRNGDWVKLTLRADSVLEISLEKGYRGEYMRGIVETVYERTNQIRLRRTDTARGEEVLIYVENNTRIYDTNRKEITIGSIRRNSLISIRGDFEGDFFVADLIDVLEE